MRKVTLPMKLILDPEILIVSGTHNAMSAQFIERVGFKAINLGETADSVDVPVFVGGDTGHGDDYRDQDYERI